MIKPCGTCTIAWRPEQDIRSGHVCRGAQIEQNDAPGLGSLVPKRHTILGTLILVLFTILLVLTRVASALKSK